MFVSWRIRKRHGGRSVSGEQPDITKRSRRRRAAEICAIARKPVAGSLKQSYGEPGGKMKWLRWSAAVHRNRKKIATGPLVRQERDATSVGAEVRIVTVAHVGKA